LKNSGQNIGNEISSLFDEPLNPVGPKAGKKAAKQIPEGLDLDSWINEPPEIEKTDYDNNTDFGFLKEESETTWDKEVDKEEQERRKESNRQRYVNNPHYLPSGPSSSRSNVVDDVDDIPIERITKEQLQGATRDTSSPFYLGGVKPPKKQKQAMTILKDDENPEGEEESQHYSSDDSDKGEDAGLKADINWNEPATELPKQQHHVVKILSSDSKKEKKKSRKVSKPKEGEEKKEKKEIGTCRW